MIELTSLSCAYGTKVVFKELSLATSQSFCVLGANGSGKSTFAKALCSFIEYDGEIYLYHQNIKNISAKERAKLISYIPTKLEIYDAFITLEEFVLQGRFIHKKSYFDYSDNDKSIAEKMMQRLQIAHLAKHTMSSLSSGEKQLSLIAQVLTQESKIIIFDEPTANLDPYNSRVIAKEIKKLQKSHQVILITHDIHLASFMTTPVLFIKESHALYFEDNFFDDDTLQKLYGVKFHSLVPSYD